jgi:putative heme-binding domain-containing protein
LLDRVAARWTVASDPVEDIHYLIVLARLPGPRSAALTARTAAALLSLDAKLDARKQPRDTNWPLRIAELQAGLVRRDPALNAALLGHESFGRAEHALFARADGFDRARAAERFLQRARAENDYPWNANVVSLLAELPAARTFPVLRQLWGEAGLDDAILPVLAKHPEPADRERFVAGLSSPQPALVKTCLDALEKLSGPLEGPGVLGLLRAAQRGGTTPAEQALRERLTAYLQRVSGQAFAGDDRAAWLAWFRKTYPALAARLDGPDGVDLAEWRTRLARLDWETGDASRGQQVFHKASCAGCHSGSQALGPDLAGIGNRFSRDDLFTAILQPSRDISARYRTTVLATDDGKVYQGLIIYDAVDGVILQTGVAATVRVPGTRIVARRTSDISLMPAGLLDRLTDREVVDLYAFLRSKR